MKKYHGLSEFFKLHPTIHTTGKLFPQQSEDCIKFTILIKICRKYNFYSPHARNKLSHVLSKLSCICIYNTMHIHINTDIILGHIVEKLNIIQGVLKLLA